MGGSDGTDHAARSRGDESRRSRSGEGPARHAPQGNAWRHTHDESGECTASSPLHLYSVQGPPGREGRHVIGQFTAMGVVPQMVEELRLQGVHVPVGLFQRSAEVEP